MSQHEFSTRETVNGNDRLRFEMALWSTLWIADQVSLMACGGCRRLASDEFSGVWPRQACGLEHERDEVDVLSSLPFSALLAMCPGRVLAAATRDGLQEKGATMEICKYVTEQLRMKTRSMRACSR